MNEPPTPQALERGWHQVNMWCTDWQAAEQAAIHRLGPRLAELERTAILAGWWFTRKDACWRVRYRPRPGQHEQASARVHELMHTLVSDGGIRRWAVTVYEPETHAFGGPRGLDIAHHLFHADSHHVLDHLRRAGDRNRAELGMLLSCALMRGAGQDYYEQGDIWAQVAAHRPTNRPPTDTEINSVSTLLTARTTNPVWTATWPAALKQAGTALADLAHDGRLTRGLRAVLAHHILFAWNRAGISARRQALLAHAAAQAIFHRQPAGTPDHPHRDSRSPHYSGDTVNTADTTHDADQLRARLVDHIRARGTFRTPAVEQAFRRVPRHLFLPGVDQATAYAPQVVVIKRADDGTALSSASHPNMVASMLEQLDVHPGNRVLEIGTATGINAALLAELVGPSGAVTTIEIDEDLTEDARGALDTAGYHNVNVLCRDGAYGHPDRAPYDRIIVTAAAWDIPTAWWKQLAPAGRIVVPLRLHDSGVTRSVAFDHQAPDRMASATAQVCGFVPLRGASDSAARTVQLTEDVTLTLATSDDHTHELGQALTHPAHEVWMGIMIDDADPVEHLDLWLATTTSHFVRLSVEPPARQSGQVTPARRWAGAALHDGAATLAYLAARPVDDHTDELGVIAHGPDNTTVAAYTTELLHRWNKQRPTQPAITAHPTGTPDACIPPATRIVRPDTTLTLTW